LYGLACMVEENVRPICMTISTTKTAEEYAYIFRHFKSDANFEPKYLVLDSWERSEGSVARSTNSLLFFPPPSSLETCIE